MGPTNKIVLYTFNCPCGFSKISNSESADKMVCKLHKKKCKEHDNKPDDYDYKLRVSGVHTVVSNNRKINKFVKDQYVGRI